MAGLTPQPLAGRRQQLRRRSALLLLAVLALALLPAGVHGAPTLGEETLLANDYLNAEGLPLLMPTNRTTNDHSWYFELPRDPAGVLVMLHRCGRNAEDFWPPSEVCPQCIGMPESVSISKQALARGYALLAINSFNRSVGSGSRCWSWHTDAKPVQAIVEGFVKEFQLEGLPLFFTGCSSGGSLALRLPGQLRIDGIMPVAISLGLDSFPATDMPPGAAPYPPVAFVHFPKDTYSDGRIQEMVGFMKGAGIPSAEARVEGYSIGEDFFSRRSVMTSLQLSRQLQAALRNLSILDAGNFMKESWEMAGVATPWEEMLEEQLGDMLAAASAEQLALKNDSTLAMAQRALDAVGEEPLAIQEISSEVITASEAEIDQADADPNFSDSDGSSSSSGDVDPYLSDALLSQHIREEMSVAWAEHTNLGDYTTAALIWLENCGKADFGELVTRFKVDAPAELSPVRTAPASQVSGTWRACSGTPEPAPRPQDPPLDVQLGSASNSDVQLGSASNSVVGSGIRGAAAACAAAACAAASAAVLL